MLKGTPKTLVEAITNGLENAMPGTPAELAPHVERHVLDYLRQHFCAAYLMAGEKELRPLLLLAQELGVDTRKC